MARSSRRTTLFVAAVAITSLCVAPMVTSMWLSFGRFQNLLGRTMIVAFDGGRAWLVIGPSDQSMPDAWHAERFDFHWDFWFEVDRSFGMQLGVPLWIPTLIGAAVAWRLRPKADPHGCPACGYDTRNNPTPICPECGHAAGTT